MSSLRIPSVLRLCRLSQSVSHNLRASAPFPLATTRRTFAEEAREKTQPGDGELSENEKKLAAEVADLTKSVSGLKEKHDELMDKYKRALAESENVRKRLVKQVDDAKVFGIQGFCKDLLEVADILGHATEAVPKDQVNNNNPHLKSLFEGLTMTQTSLNQVFKRHGLITVNPMNEKFNPNLHEALFQKEDTSVEPNTVVIVSKIGYKLHERCIRPALVGVSKGSA